VRKTFDSAIHLHQRVADMSVAGRHARGDLQAVAQRLQAGPRSPRIR
jgi:hypothetical protein